MDTQSVVKKKRKVKRPDRRLLYPDGHPLGFSEDFPYNAGVHTTLIRLFKSSIVGAKLRVMKHTISLRDLEDLWTLQNGRCALSGLEMTYDDPLGLKPDYTMTRYRFHRASIDRIDSARGYDAKNVHLVCAALNLMKQDLPMVDFVVFCKSVASKYAGPLHF